MIKFRVLSLKHEMMEEEARGGRRALQETIYSMTEQFRHRSLKIRHKIMFVTFLGSVMY